MEAPKTNFQIVALAAVVLITSVLLGVLKFFDRENIKDLNIQGYVDKQHRLAFTIHRLIIEKTASSQEHDFKFYLQIQNTTPSVIRESDLLTREQIEEYCRSNLGATSEPSASEKFVFCQEFFRDFNQIHLFSRFSQQSVFNSIFGFDSYSLVAPSGEQCDYLPGRSRPRYSILPMPFKPNQTADSILTFSCPSRNGLFTLYLWGQKIVINI